MRIAWGLAAVVATCVLVGCSGPADSPDAPVDQPSAAADAAPEIEPIAALDDLAGTSWRGDDTEGDRHTFTFGSDGLVTHDSYGAKQEVSWTVVGDTVVFRISFGPGDALDFTTTLDADAQTLTAQGVDAADPDDQLTIELTRFR